VFCVIGTATVEGRVAMTLTDTLALTPTGLPVMREPVTKRETNRLKERDHQTKTGRVSAGGIVAVSVGTRTASARTEIERRIVHVTEGEQHSEKVAVTETGPAAPASRRRTASRRVRDTETRTARMTWIIVDDVKSHVIEAEIARYSATATFSLSSLPLLLLTL